MQCCKNRRTGYTARGLYLKIIGPKNKTEKVEEDHPSDENEEPSNTSSNPNNWETHGIANAQDIVPDKRDLIPTPIFEALDIAGGAIYKLRKLIISSYYLCCYIERSLIYYTEIKPEKVAN